MLNEHVLLIVHSDTSLAWFSVALATFKGCLKFVNIDFLLCSILLGEFKGIVLKCETCRASPESSIMSVDCCVFAHIGDFVSLSSCVIHILDLVDIAVPT